MRSKIEKKTIADLEQYCGRCNEQVFSDSEHWCLPEKIDQIISLLNSQDQEEEKIMTAKNIDFKEEMRKMEHNEDIIFRGKKGELEELNKEHLIEDTPEEWRRNIKEVIESKTPYEARGMSKFEIVEWIVDELLEEREKEVLDKLNNK